MCYVNVLRYIDIYVVLAINTEQLNVYLPQKRDKISNFYQEYPQTSPTMSNVMFVSDLFNRVSSTTNCKLIDRYANIQQVKQLHIYVKIIEIFLCIAIVYFKISLSNII